jgi:hypothetical protein
MFFFVLKFSNLGILIAKKTGKNNANNSQKNGNKKNSKKLRSQVWKKKKVTLAE